MVECCAFNAILQKNRNLEIEMAPRVFFHDYKAAIHLICNFFQIDFLNNDDYGLEEILNRKNQTDTSFQERVDPRRSAWRRKTRLVGPHPERLEDVRTERVDERNIGGVAPARDQDAADARHVVAGVEGVPLAAEEASNQALKSIGAGSGGTPMSPR